VSGRCPRRRAAGAPWARRTLVALPGSPPGARGGARWYGAPRRPRHTRQRAGDARGLPRPRATPPLVLRPPCRVPKRQCRSPSRPSRARIEPLSPTRRCRRARAPRRAHAAAPPCRIAVAYVKYDRASCAALAIEALHQAVLNNGKGPKLKVMLAEAPPSK
jgi:hypothetical protein